MVITNLLTGYQEKARWEQKDSVYSFEQILKEASSKIIIVRPLVSHFKNHSSQMNKTCWALLEKQTRIQNQGSPGDSHRWTHQCWPTNKDIFTSVLCQHEMPSRRPTKSNGQWDR